MTDSEPEAPFIGLIVHYVLRDGPHVGECRPAIVLRVFNPASAALLSLMVLMDPVTDLDSHYHGDDPQPGVNGIVVQQTYLSDEHLTGTWHYPHPEKK